MQISTTRFGDLEVSADDVIFFVDGMPGFPNAENFVLIPVDGSDDHFYWLQSIDDGALAFLTTIPWPMFPDYAPVIDDGTQEELHLTSEEDALVLCLLTVLREEKRVTANLLGPVVVNMRNRRAAQVIQTDVDWPTRAPMPTKDEITQTDEAGTEVDEPTGDPAE